MKQMEARAREVWLVWLTSQVPVDGATGGDNVTESKSGGGIEGGWGQLEFLMKKKKSTNKPRAANSTNGLRHKRTNLQSNKKRSKTDTM